MENNLNIYVDGSFDGKVASWAYLVIKNDKIIHKDRGIILDDKANESYQIAGEYEAVIQSLKYLNETNQKATYFYDYAGLKEFVADIWGRKPWRTNKEVSVNYRRKVLENKHCIVGMVKVKSHDGNRWNEEVDKFASIKI